MDFEWQPVLQDAFLRLDPLAAGDFEALKAAASDPLIWAGHPAKTRHQPEVFAPYFEFLLSTQSALCVRDPAGEVIGCSRFYSAPDGRDQISIGFTFLVRKHWGGAMNFCMKRLMFEHIFQTRDAVWLHVGLDNIRSQTATGRLGARAVATEELDLGQGAAAYLCYELRRADWDVVAARRATELGCVR